MCSTRDAQCVDVLTRYWRDCRSQAASSADGGVLWLAIYADTLARVYPTLMMLAMLHPNRPLCQVVGVGRRR